MNIDLSDERANIDRLDREILDAFTERLRICSKIAEKKKISGLPVYDPVRERELEKKVMLNAGEEFEIQAKILFSTIMSLSRSYQRACMNNDTELTSRLSNAILATPKQFPEKAVVACQGIDGAFSQQAAKRLFKYPDMMFFNQFENVFSAVEQGLCKYGVLPVENSEAGSVNKIYDLMRKHKFHIVRSVTIPIRHSLLAKTDMGLSNITDVYSHEQALLQCSDFIDSHPNMRRHPVENTAIAAKMVASGDSQTSAAIASSECAEMYRLSEIEHNIENSHTNTTRFICISKDLEIYPGADRTSIMLTLPNHPGSLYGVISEFAALDINLIKLESRPIPEGNREFCFYFDIETSVYSDSFYKLISSLEKDGTGLAYLGSYSEIRP